MRLGGRLSAAIEVLGDIERRHRPASEALKDWGLAHRFAGSGDRAAIGNIVYGALRRRRSAAWIFDDDSPRALGFGALILEGGLSPEAIDAALEKDAFAPAPLDAGERDVLAARPVAEAPEPVRADCPDWCVPLLQEAFGPDWVEEGAALALRPPLDMRANTLKAAPEKALRALSHLRAAPTPTALAGLRIPPVEGNGRHPHVQSEPAFARGLFEVQDEGSQIAVELAGPEPGTQVLDFCAGAGGKTLAASALMDNRGQMFAYDADRRRLAPIFERIKRAGCRNVQAVAEEEALAELEGRMDLVLVDAPCTGSGTWRRRPDAKWRLTPKQLRVRMSEQATILDRAARFVKPGGRLAYITCSVFAEENKRQAVAFVKRSPDFSPLDHEALWRGRFPGRDNAARVDAQGVSLSPARTETDGFFFCALQREK